MHASPRLMVAALVADAAGAASASSFLQTLAVALVSGIATIPAGIAITWYSSRRKARRDEPDEPAVRPSQVERDAAHDAAAPTGHDELVAYLKAENIALREQLAAAPPTPEGPRP